MTAVIVSVRAIDLLACHSQLGGVPRVISLTRVMLKGECRTRVRRRTRSPWQEVRGTRETVWKPHRVQSYVRRNAPAGPVGCRPHTVCLPTVVRDDCGGGRRRSNIPSRVEAVSLRARVERPVLGLAPQRCSRDERQMRDRHRNSPYN